MPAENLAPASSSGLWLPAEAPRYARHDRFRIPLDHPCALNFYINNLLIAQSRGTVLRAAVARTLAPFACGGLALDLEKAGIADARASRLCSLLRDAEVVGNGMPSAITLDDHDHSNRGKIVMFILEHGAKRPSVVVKASTRAEHSETLLREQASLRLLRAKVGEQLRAALPTPLAALKSGGETIVAETCFSGTSIYGTMRNSLLPRRHADSHFALSLDWLARFQNATRACAGALGDGAFAGLVTEPLRRFERLCEPIYNERTFIAALERKAQALKDEGIFTCAGHGDFWAGNLIITPEGLGVFDWEGFRERCNPFHDLFMFVTGYGLNYPWRFGRYWEPGRAFNATFSGEEWMAKLVRNHLLRYCAAIGASPRLLEVFLPVFLATRAAEESAASCHLRAGTVTKPALPERCGRSPITPMWRGLFREYVHMDAAGHALRLPNLAVEHSE